MELTDQITQYLSHGGFFNPEQMDHDKVRDLLIACRDELFWQKQRIESLDIGQTKLAAIANRMETERDAANKDAEALAFDLKALRQMVAGNYGGLSIGCASLAAHEERTKPNPTAHTN